MVVVCLLVAAAVLGRPAAADEQTWQAAYEAGDYQRAASLLQPLVIAAMDQATPDDDPAPSRTLATMYAQGLGVERDSVLACSLAQQSQMAVAGMAPRLANDLYRHTKLQQEADRFRDELCGGLSAGELVAAGNSIGCYKFGVSPQVIAVGQRSVRVDREGIGLTDGGGTPFQWDCAQAVAGLRVFEVTPPRDALAGVTTRHYIESLTWHVGRRPDGTRVTELHWTLLEVGPRELGQAAHERLPWSGDWPGLEQASDLAPALSMQMIRTGHVRWRIEGTPPLRGWILRSEKKERGE